MTTAIFNRIRELHPYGALPFDVQAQLEALSAPSGFYYENRDDARQRERQAAELAAAGLGDAIQAHADAAERCASYDQQGVWGHIAAAKQLRAIRDKIAAGADWRKFRGLLTGDASAEAFETETVPAVEVYLYGMVGDFGSGSITAQSFISKLNAYPVDTPLNLRINSNGGSVHDGLAIFNYLRGSGRDITTYIDGIAASIASIIALAGQKTVMPANALFMIHNPWSWVQGTSADMRKAADALDVHKQSLVGIYEAKTGRSYSQLAAWMDEETWMTGEEAHSYGFVDELAGTTDVSARARNLSARGFYNCPPQFKSLFRP